MRPILWVSVRPLAICISCVVLLLVLCSSVWTQETRKINPRIKELQQQRLAILEEICDMANRLYRNSRLELEAVNTAERELLEARIAYAETQQERIKACDDAIKDATVWRELAQTRKESARGTEMSVSKARAFILEAQIAREKVATDE